MWVWWFQLWVAGTRAGLWGGGWVVGVAPTLDRGPGFPGGWRGSRDLHSRSRGLLLKPSLGVAVPSLGLPGLGEGA